MIMNDITEYDFRFLHVPWDHSASDSNQERYVGRPCVDVPSQISQIVCIENGERLPRIAEFQDLDRRNRKLFELPASQCDEPMALKEEVLNLNFQFSDGQVVRRTVILGAALLTPSATTRIADSQNDPSDTKEDETETLDKSVRESVAVQRLLDDHVDAMNSIFDDVNLTPGRWDGKARDVAVRSLPRTLMSWEHIADKDEPPRSLIVQLARSLPQPLRSVCDQPHKVLRRIRQMVPVGSVQEVDDGCLRWLARQPGRTLLERAGPKQRILGITRVDNLDTTENRVVKDLLSRLAVECRRYCVEYRHFKENPSYKCEETGALRVHPRFTDVERLLSLVRSLLRVEMMGTIRRLVGAATPNYVLQHEPRYKKIWLAYQQLVRHQKQQDTLWRWRNRTLDEVGGLAISAAINQLAESGSSQRSDLILQSTHVGGQFIAPFTEIGFWEYGDKQKSSYVQQISRTSISRISAVPASLIKMAPSYVLTQSNSTWVNTYDKMLAVFVVNGFGIQPHDWKLEHLAEGLANIQSQIRVRGLLLVLSDKDGATQMPTGDSRCNIIPLSGSIQKCIPAVIDTLRDWMNLP